MRKVPITITMPENLIRDLHLYVSQRGISSFVSGLVRQGLEEKKQLLAKEFEEASKDEERNAELSEWDSLSGDGLNDQNDH